MRSTSTLVAALTAAGVIGAGVAVAASTNATHATSGLTTSANAVPVAPSNANGIAPVAAPNYRAIVQQFGPAVVGVVVEGLHPVSAEDGADPQALPPFLRGMPGLQQRGGGARPFKGQGSGFIVSADGIVLTNAHVVRDAKEVTVRLQDRREYRAKVLGADAATDVAVLRIEAKELPAVRLGDPKALEVGDPVLAIGAPYGLEQTATQGIVSAKGRSLPGDAYVPFIQTDAAVNPGNSGGPLFDGAGNVVGINAQIYSQTGGYQGLAFAIPIDVALKVKDQIVAHGKASHARLGVTVQDLNQNLASSFGLERPDGALVAQVGAGSPAAQAGLKPGDVITAIDGQAIERAGGLSSRIGLASPGDKVRLSVWRDKSSRELEVKLAGLDDRAAARGAAAEGAGADGARLGLALRPLSPAEARGGQVEQGLLVQGVAGAAARAGVEPGDVLLAVNGQPVGSVAQIQGVLKSKPKAVALLIDRGGERIFVPLQIG